MNFTTKEGVFSSPIVVTKSYQADTLKLRHLFISLNAAMNFPKQNLFLQLSSHLNYLGIVLRCYNHFEEYRSDVITENASANTFDS